MGFKEMEAEVEAVSPMVLGPVAAIVRKWGDQRVRPEEVLELAAQMRSTELIAWLEEGRRKIARQRRPRA